MAAQVHDSDGLVSLIGCVGATAIGECGYAGGIVAHRNGKRGAEGRAVVAVLIQAHIDVANGVAVIISHDQLAGCRVVLSIDRAGYAGDILSCILRESRAGRKRQTWMAGDLLAILVEERSAGVQRVVLAVDYSNRVVAPIQHKETPVVGTLHGVYRALAQGNAGRDCVGDGPNRVRLANGTRTGREVAVHTRGIGDVLTDGVVVQADRA